MKFVVKQKVAYMTDRYVIEDENGNIVYKVARQVYSLRKRWFIRDTKENGIAVIEKKVFCLGKKFEIGVQNNCFAKVDKKFNFLKDVFTVESNMGNYLIKGNYFLHEYQIFKDDQTVCTISKKWMTFGDTYGVEINDDDNVGLMIALAILIDASHEG